MYYKTEKIRLQKVRPVCKKTRGKRSILKKMSPKKWTDKKKQRKQGETFSAEGWSSFHSTSYRWKSIKMLWCQLRSELHILQTYWRIFHWRIFHVILRVWHKFCPPSNIYIQYTYLLYIYSWTQSKEKSLNFYQHTVYMAKCSIN
jgi:hypothetical protein